MDAPKLFVDAAMLTAMKVGDKLAFKPLFKMGGMTKAEPVTLVLNSKDSKAARKGVHQFDAYWLGVHLSAKITASVNKEGFVSWQF